MKRVVIAMAMIGMLGAGPAQAQDAALKAGGCIGCHDLEKKKMGPAFKDVAAKYKDSKDAAGTLAAKLKEGKGHPKINKSDDEIKSALGAALSAK